MNLKVSLLFSLFPLLCCANAFNITNLLAHHQEFRSFNRYLTQTHLAEEINSRSALTVLAVDNAAMSPIAMRPADVVKKILSVHVVLEYYDAAMLGRLSNKTTVLTTLLQSSGEASGRQGYLKVSNMGAGKVVVKSAAKGTTFSAKLVKSVAAQPRNISILQISNVIIPSGIGSDTISQYALAPMPVRIATVSKAIKTTSKAKAHASESSDSSSSPAEAPAPAPAPAPSPKSNDDAPPPSKTKRPASSPPPSSDDEAPPPSKTKRGAPPPSKSKRRPPPASDDDSPAPSDEQSPAPSSDDDSGDSNAPAPGPSKSKSKSKPPSDSNSDLLPSSPDGPSDIDVPVATDTTPETPPSSAAAPFSPSLGVVLTALLATLSLASVA